jgi:hypothetical protein
MLDGIMLLWFILTAAALLFVAIDIRTTPESPVLKWGFVLVTAYTGVVGAFLYVLGCREPLPGLHERYVAARWRQALGSAMHCVAGDGVGILAGAVLASALGLTGLAEIILEYLLGFAFGWAIFQVLLMRDMAGGSYRRALASTFVRELLSMNLLMAGMMPAVMLLRALHPIRRPCRVATLLVCDVDGSSGRVRRRLSDQLVAGSSPSQARHDDDAAGRRTARRNGNVPAAPCSAAAAARAGHGTVVLPGLGCRRRGRPRIAEVIVSVSSMRSFFCLVAYTMDGGEFSVLRTSATITASLALI